ncbi:MULTISPECIES: STM4015 family protein [Streptomyces]|uniref:STM4015 family protein n=1 Tax=Streptomyces TaxID=1883 RepID=UPI000BD135D8|nr:MULTISPECIES: STM4015 family protein [Streptomyces]MDX2552315.1 STM4015 family protein [Streptomyces stelliscabiei]MDX2611710.1 STM4015 family protein [Streptomyces stelliscabiei]MDX2637059.1 STM4015 family protein [Streptomyces stelliscabiei]MDX2660476.1 STM4015 family protein [Streptomyces stelliscabiei]MDX2714782.1 STM4015 family protein [Streptomyces stelliscabiei]
MTIGSHLEEFHGLPVHRFPKSVKSPQGAGHLPAPESVAWSIAVESYDSDESWEEAFARFLASVGTEKVRALVVGAWSDAYDHGPEEIVAALVAAKDRLPSLRALFLGDIVGEECEISWINQGDVSPLLDAFPELEEFGVRGGQGLGFPALRHERLRTLTIETGGLPVDVVRGVAGSDLPALVELDLWLGTPEYGGDCEVADLAPILAGTRLPALKHLALRNSEMQDDVCAALASAPVVARLDVLDVSMGVLTDDGATALLTGQPLTHLTTLDLHHNYLSPALRDRLRDSLEAEGVQVDVDADDAESDEEEDGTVWRFVAVGE